MVIRSTRHHILDANQSKTSGYESFVSEYSRVALIMINMVWEKLPEDLNLPKYLNYKDYDIQTPLSARALSSIATQVSGIIRAAIDKEKRRIWVRKNKGVNLKRANFSKPNLTFVAPELSSKCCDIKKSPEGKFWGFLHLKSLGKLFGSIKIPIIKHPRIGDFPKAGVKLFKYSLQLVWEIPSTANRGHSVVGADTGFKTVLTLSDGQRTPTTCPHGHSYESVVKKLCRKKRGSKAFRMAAAHRKNFVNFSINQLNLTNAKEVRLEKVVNIRFRRRVSKELSHWSNPEICDKLKSRCSELEVPVIEQPSAYRSQRCSQCGNVRKSNRKDKVYLCKNCGYSADADLNAAINHSIDLPQLPKEFSSKRPNLGSGFFWNPDGFKRSGVTSPA